MQQVGEIFISRQANLDMKNPGGYVVEDKEGRVEGGSGDWYTKSKSEKSLMGKPMLWRELSFPSPSPALLRSLTRATLASPYPTTPCIPSQTPPACDSIPSPDTFSPSGASAHSSHDDELSRAQAHFFKTIAPASASRLRPTTAFDEENASKLSPSRKAQDE
ncbi:hypothetical protein Pst134EA_031247 [Puccinia striiformis f. sp. tritici]|uniref:uncharacterized protein n=1 Tax=Puccinia striiformis f. sp. tritici TaxID=168172 RepID=UPI0020074E4E|nr:uncharacterized protein Pst134EA_031247 [Puccinia striiformis f. sp. tritici]KAH9443410.1 hypothetical protein Pst134EA_031247 [Puccinia striiformis f. sp. tritici]